MFSGTHSRRALCHPALSRTSTTGAFGAGLFENSWRKTLITAAVANGITRANASSGPARTAPKRETEAKRLSAGAVGRTPFSNQTWVARPFCPTRASSLHEASVVNDSSASLLLHEASVVNDSSASLLFPLVQVR